MDDAIEDDASSDNEVQEVDAANATATAMVVETPVETAVEAAARKAAAATASLATVDRSDPAALMFAEKHAKDSAKALEVARMQVRVNAEFPEDEQLAALKRGSAITTAGMVGRMA